MNFRWHKPLRDIRSGSPLGRTYLRVHSYTESRCPDAGMRQLHLCVRMLAQGARRCVGKYDSAFRPVSACLSAGKQWPLACPPAPPPPPPPVDARWFCHEERSAKSFYDRCSGPCVSTPVCGPQDTLLRSCAVLATTTHSPSHLGTYAYVCVRLKQICCDFGTARISQHYPGARRCVTGDAAHRAGVGRCDSKPFPAACNGGDDSGH